MLTYTFSCYHVVQKESYLGFGRKSDWVTEQQKRRNNNKAEKTWVHEILKEIYEIKDEWCISISSMKWKLRKPRPTCSPRTYSVQPAYLCAKTVTLYNEKYLPDITKHILLMSPVSGSIFTGRNCSAQWKTLNQELSYWWTLEGKHGNHKKQKLNIILKGCTTRRSAKYITNDWFCKRNLICEAVYISKFVACLTL
jgi:hypothetical protein